MSSSKSKWRSNATRCYRSWFLQIGLILLVICVICWGGFNERQAQQRLVPQTLPGPPSPYLLQMCSAIWSLKSMCFGVCQSLVLAKATRERTQFCQILNALLCMILSRSSIFRHLESSGQRHNKASLSPWRISIRNFCPNFSFEKTEQAYFIWSLAHRDFITPHPV